MLAENPGIKVLGLSTFADRRMVLQMLEAGARGYVAKSAGSEELLRGIRASVAQGAETYLCMRRPPRRSSTACAEAPNRCRNTHERNPGPT